MIGNHNHAVAGKKLRAFAIGRQEGALIAAEPLRAVDCHALPRQQLGQCVDLSLDAQCPVGIDVDQPPAGVLA